MKCCLTSNQRGINIYTHIAEEERDLANNEIAIIVVVLVLSSFVLWLLLLFLLFFLKKRLHNLLHERFVMRLREVEVELLGGLLPNLGLRDDVHIRFFQNSPNRRLDSFFDFSFHFGNTLTGIDSRAGVWNLERGNGEQWVGAKAAGKAQLLYLLVIWYGSEIRIRSISFYQMLNVNMFKLVYLKIKIIHPDFFKKKKFTV